ncbi:phage antirepressor N-terminal domain-containing protein [Laribacter hongkongensis]|nr:phage antirepressor N-terminal domain-containing protein [Laribacter hongkongensis]MCG9087700.1 phage antirepressor N-terminal domain-containing protein [Laribacter hongkongensis]MCG9110815.1 phage antirepressor N-terminal domain-containing protein [Laribacter hongkongensis]MCG9122659.1 phage antirepressor N-terminal domain-containing protein [Laribacter hongkongensis]
MLVGHDNEPFVAMKPVVTNMGLDWAAQFTKLKEKFSSTIGEITTVGEDGKYREMVCLPLRKLPAWLYSINHNKVKPELQDKIVRYQNE